MQFRQEILRGVRLAAMMFAVLLIALAAYRVRRPAPAPPARQERQEATPPAFAPAPSPPAEPAEAVGPKVTPTVARPSRAVPRPVHWVTRTVVAAAPAVVNPGDPATAPPATPEPTRNVEETAAPVVAKETQEPIAEPPADLSAPSAPQEPAAHKPGNRGTRVLRSVGRFLHIGGKKAAQPEGGQQP